MSKRAENVIYLPSALFSKKLPLGPEDEKAFIVTLAFRKAAEKKLKDQFTCLFIGLIFITASIVLFMLFLSPLLFFGGLIGAVILVYGFSLKPYPISFIAKAYCVAYVMPFDKGALIFDANGLIEKQTFSYASIPVEELDQTLKSLPYTLSLENELLLKDILGRISKITQQSRTESVVSPIATEDHLFTKCVLMVLQNGIAGHPSELLPTIFDMKKAVDYINALLAIERSTKLLNQAKEECQSSSQIFTNQLEKNLNIVQKYFQDFNSLLRYRLLGGYSYHKVEDPDVIGFETYDVTKLPIFVNAITPFQRAISVINEPIKSQVQSIKHEFEGEKARLYKELDRRKKEIDFETQRDVRKLKSQRDSLNRKIHLLRRKQQVLRNKLEKERHSQYLKLKKDRDWSQYNSLSEDLKILTREIGDLEKDLKEIDGCISDEVGRAKDEKKRLERETREDVHHLITRAQEEIKQKKEPVLKLQKSRDVVIDLLTQLLNDFSVEERVQSLPYDKRLNEIKQTCAKTLSILQEYASTRETLITQIKRNRLNIKTDTPTQICFPFWFVEIKTEEKIERVIFSPADVSEPVSKAISWVRDFAEFYCPKEPFNSYTRYLQADKIFDEARGFAEKKEELIKASRLAENLLKSCMISNRVYKKIVKYFGD